jgi:YVTN family beta-propeller protein
MSKRLHAATSVAAALALAASLASAARAAEPSTERLYVSDETGGNVVIVDPQAQQVVTRIPVGKRPRGIELALDHHRVYVALTGSPAAGPNVDESKLPPPDHRYDGIGVVDLKAQRLVNTYPSGMDPETFALSHDGCCTCPTRTADNSRPSIWAREHCWQPWRWAPSPRASRSAMTTRSST